MMNEEIVNKLFQYVDVIGEKLNFATGELMAVYVKQSFVLGINEIISGIFLILFSVIIFFYIKYVERGAQEGKYKDEDGKQNGVEILQILLWIIIIIFGFVIVDCARDAVGYFINPEYYAVKNVLETLQK